MTQKPSPTAPAAKPVAKTKAVASKTAKTKVATKKPSAVSAKPKVAAVKALKTTSAATSANTATKSSKAAVKQALVVTPVKAPKAKKPKEQKMVRDGFTMPENDYANIAALKKRCLKAGTSAKKSEVIRAALHCLAGLSDQALLKAIASLEPIKAGRPKKN
jgi:hypothetical protein